MTFLGWMHRKLTHNSTEAARNSRIGNHCACFSVQTLHDEQHYYVEETKNLSHSKNNFHKSSKRFPHEEVEGPFHEELLEPFEFLAIGTFGMELHGTDPPTPTLPVPSKDLTDYQTAITQNDLKLINYELEKFLEAEEKELANNTSGRSSQASIITLSNKPIEGEDFDGQAYFMDFPLQNYLLANSIEVADTNNEKRKEYTYLEVADPTGGFNQAEQPSRKRVLTRFMKKVGKKLHSLSTSSTATSKDEATVPFSKKKLSKVIKKLQRKVHPEEMADKHIPEKVACNIKVDDEDKIVGPASSRKSEKNTEKLFSDDICKCSSTINGGRWIKTDSDYLILEL